MTPKVAAQKPEAMPEKTQADEPKQAVGTAQVEVSPAAGPHVSLRMLRCHPPAP